MGRLSPGTDDGPAVVLVVVAFLSDVNGMIIVGLGLEAVGAEATGGLMEVIGGLSWCSLYVLFGLRNG